MEGRQFAAYTLQEEIGTGGMGAVYRASDRRIGRTVAIKIIRPDKLLSEKARERFAREARSIGALNHPNIATLHDVSLDGETPFIVMEYLPSGSLSKRIGRGPLPLHEILRWAIHICAGLEHAHAHGVIHRDLKPGNILFSAEGMPKVIDFGLALMPDSSELTASGVMMGTAAYMSPEQASAKPVDLRSDIFSFGVILYHMATGQNPFACDSIPETLHRIVYDPAPPLASARPDLPEPLSRLVGTLISKRPEDRPRNLTPVLQELRSLQTSLDSAETRTMTEAQVSSRGLRRLNRRPRWPAAAILLVVLIGLALAAAWWLRNRRLPPALPATRQLVVLPFDSLSHDPSEQAFCDGVIDVLTSTLSETERFHNSLWVIPSADVRNLRLHDVRGTHQALPAVNLVVTGSLQTNGASILAIVNLSDAATTRQIASRSVPVSVTEPTRLAPLLTQALLDMLDLGAGGDANALQGVQSKVPSAYDLYLQGKGFLQHFEVPSNVNSAINVLEKSVRLDPAFAMAQATLASAYLLRYTSTKEKEWLAKADQMVHQSLDLDGNQAFAHLILGRVCDRTGQFDQAISEILRAISIDPLNVAAYNNLAIAYADAGRPADAEKTYLRAIGMRPGYWPVYFDLGAFYEVRGEYPRALDQLSLGIKLAPEYAQGHNTLGSLYYLMEQFDDALVEFNRSLALRPTPLAYSNRGDLYRLRGNYSAAQADYRSALTLSGNNPLIWGNLAAAQSQLPGAANDARDSWNHAIALCREQLSVNPKNADLLAQMAYYLAKVSSCSEARKNIREARKLAPDLVSVIFQSAKIELACDDRESGLLYLKSAVIKGYPLHEIESDPDFSQLRHTAAYAAIVKKHAGN